MIATTGDLTEVEAKTLYDANAAGLQLRFTEYYKYTFTYTGDTPRMRVRAEYSGRENIYRYTVTPAPLAAPATLEALQDEYTNVTITDVESGKSYEWNDDNAW